MEMLIENQNLRVKLGQEAYVWSRNFDWEKQIKLSIDPEKARRYHEEGKSGEKDVCTMCGEFCAIKRVKDFFKNS
jgi:phosphomethylpyrimidine synthase